MVVNNKNKFIKPVGFGIKAPGELPDLDSLGGGIKEFKLQDSTSTLPDLNSLSGGTSDIKLPDTTKALPDINSLGDRTTQKTGDSRAAQSGYPISRVPETFIEKFTRGMANTVPGLIAAVNVAPTIFGGKLEQVMEASKRVEGDTYKQRFMDIIKKQIQVEKEDPWHVAKKYTRSLTGDMEEIGTEKAVKDFSQTYLTKGDELTNKQNFGAVAASVALDIILDPLTYLTFGGSSLLQIGGKGLTKVGVRAYSKLIAEGVAKGLTREAATKTAKELLEGLIKQGLSHADDLAKGGKVGVNLLPDALKPATKKGGQLFTEGGIRAAEWLPKIGGESLVPWKAMEKVLGPVGKVTGISKIVKSFKGKELTKAITKAVSTTAGTPVNLAKFAKKAKALREVENIKEMKEVIKPLTDLGKFTKKEAEEIFEVIRKPESYTNAVDKIKGAADIIGKRFTDIRTNLVNRGVDIGWLDNYVPQLYNDMYGKEFVENLKKFATELPGKASKSVTETLERATSPITEGGLKRGKEFFEHPRSLFKTVEEAEAAGHKINKNIFDLLNAYESGATRIHAFMDLAEKVKPLGINLADMAKAGGKIPEGYIKGSGMLSNIALPKDVANYLGSFQKTFLNNKEAMVFLKHYDKALRWWKTLATVVSPGFHFRNFISNTSNSWLGGNKNPLNYMDAAKSIKNKINPKGGTNMITTQGGEKVTGSWIVDEAVKRRVLGTGWFGSAGELGGKSIKETLEPTTDRVLRGLNPLSSDSYLARGGKKLGVTVEEYSRLAHFIDVFKKTGDLDLAAEETFKYLFDYGDLTAFWKNVMNRVFPFGTWMRKNTALQFEQLIKQPAKFGLIGKAKKLIESISEGVKPDETFLPEWLKEEVAIRTPFKDSKGNFIYMRLDLPYLGIGDVTDWRNLAGGITPALKTPAELFFGKELFTGKPIERYPGYTTSVPGYIGMLPDAIKRKLGVVRAKNPKTGKLEERMDPYAAYLLRQNPLMSKIGKLIPFAEETEYQTTSRPFKLASILGGIGITPYDVKYRRKVWEKEEAEKYNAYKKRLKEIQNWGK